MRAPDALLSVFIVLSSGCVIPAPGGVSGGMTFLVDVPENTPEGDTVWIYIGHTRHKMEEVGNHSYRFVLQEEPEDVVRYRYSRNGYNFRTAEYLAPTAEEPDRDTNNYFWTKLGRTTSYNLGKVQHDDVDRWRWFPEGALPPGTTSLEPRGTFLARMDGAEFRSGQTIEDLYESAYWDFLDSTAARLKAQGFTWVEFDPPWQWVEESGLPKVKNDIGNAPNYPDDETFLRELRAHTSIGLKAMVAPQLCCNALNTKGRSAAWWEAYFDETERFLVHFANLSEAGGADAFYYNTPEFETHEASDAAAQWSRIFASVRRVFSGEVGRAFGILGPEVSPTPQLVPLPSAVEWADELDFFLVHTDFPLSTADDPTDAELLEGARFVVNGTRDLFDMFGKPVLLRNGYFNVKQSWKGQTFYHIDSVPWIDGPEADLARSKYQLDGHDHARTINATFAAIAESPWIVGYFHFGYTHWEDPLSAWMSVRGKPPEDMWRKWNEHVYGEAS